MGIETFLYRNFPQPPKEPQPAKVSAEKPVKIIYAGLLGIAQGILKLCEEIELDGVNYYLDSKTQTLYDVETEEACGTLKKGVFVPL